MLSEPHFRMDHRVTAGGDGDPFSDRRHSDADRAARTIGRVPLFDILKLKNTSRTKAEGRARAPYRQTVPPLVPARFIP